MSQSQAKEAPFLLGSPTFVIDQTADVKKLTGDLRVSVLCNAQPSERGTFHTNAHGFSLIEMLVARVVLSLSLSVLYQAAMGATRNVRSFFEPILSLIHSRFGGQLRRRFADLWTTK